jgi:hypothetical protein
LRSELPTDTFPSVIQSVTTDGNFSVRNSVGRYRQNISVGIYRRNYGRKSFRIKKRRVADVEVLAGHLFSDDITDGFKNDSSYNDVTGAPFTLPTDSSRDLKWQIRTVTCLCFRQNHRRDHRRIFRRWIRREKLIYVSSADSLLPYFSFFFPNPNSPHLQTTSPPPPQKKVFLISAQQVIFLEVLWSQHPCSDLPKDFINFCK